MKLFEINTRVEHIDSEGKVTVIEEVISDDGRPSDGNEGNPDDPKPDDPVAEGPTIEAVAWCNMKGIISGKPDSVYDPKGTAKRGEMAAVITMYLTGEE